MATAPMISRQASARENVEFLPIEVGNDIWIPGKDTVWELASVMAIGDLKVTARSKAGKVQQVDRGLALPLNPRVTDDMTSLYYIHEAGVLYNLEQRSSMAETKPYTFMANVLIAVNPLKAIANPDVSDIVQNGSSAPHPYAIAELAYQQMAYNASEEMPTNQSIVISGESGAGKTESSKIALKHLTTRGVHGKLAKKSEIKAGHVEGGNSLDRRLIEQNPILEAFGNAKTLRNHNSSRFGKFMKLQFTSGGDFKLAGAFVETYLLEKSRLVYQVDGERNFHIFYQLIRGADAAMQSSFKLGKPEDFYYLNQSGCFEAEGTNDSESFQDVVQGLSCVGIAGDDQSAVLAIIASLLHIGNIAFEEEETSEGEAAILANTEQAKVSLEAAGKLLGIESSYLFKVVGEREIVTRDETFTVRRNAQNALYARDAIAKSVYGRLFDWIIQRVNKSLGQDPAPLPYIGVLDIFGFESFQRNDFEQLLINYTNEVLQATFNNQVFIAEMELYKREGITVGKIEWPDNRECVDLIASKPSGILTILDNEAMNPKPSDEKFVALLHKTHTKNKYFPRPHPKDMKEMFIVRHFAGCVTYTAGAFMDKNNDTIPKDMADLYLSSNVAIVRELFQQESDEMAEAKKSTRRPKKRLKSVAAKFSLQMNQLVETLDATRCNFIRCIKPNAMMKPGYFDPRYVVGQLRCQGIMQTAQVLKVGLPTRVGYAELVGAYKQFMPPDAQRLFAQQSDATLITAILWAFQVPMDSYKLGITKLFFKAGKISILDSILKINWAVDGPRIVGRMKLWLARRRWRVALAKVQAQLAWNTLLRRMRFRRDAVRMLQVWWRGFSVRRTFLKKRKAIVLIQATYRGYKGRSEFKERRQEMLAVAAAKAEEARKQAEVAKAKQEEARLAAEAARREAESREAADEERRKMEEEAQQAENEAHELARQAMEAVKEAEDAAAAASAAVDAERKAEQRAIHEAEELERRLENEREEAEKRKQEALLNAASISARVLGGLGQMTTQQGSTGNVHVVEIPHDLCQENKEQLQQLNELLLSGAMSQDEYDELVPFLIKDESAEPRNAQMTAEQEEALTRLYSEGVYGVQIRCPACGINNNTANGNNCTDCGAQLTAAASRPEEHRYYGSRSRSMSQQHLSRGVYTPSSNFEMDGQRIRISGGFFQCEISGTQVLADENYAEYTVYVVKCGWQDESQNSPSYWMVSHRYSNFERLHKDLKLKIPPHVATLPQFPRKHRLGGVFHGKTGNSNEIVDERKSGLSNYINQVIDICAKLPDTLNVPELDRFLNLSQQVQQIKQQLEQALGQNYDAAEFSAEAGGAEGLAAREARRLPSELPNPLDGFELTQTEQAVSSLEHAIRNSQGDIRRNHEVQHLVKVCVQLQPRLQMSASLDNPFADVDLIPRAMQCQEDLEHTMGLYNDTLLAVSESYAISENVTAPAPFVPGSRNF